MNIKTQRKPEEMMFNFMDNLRGAASSEKISEVILTACYLFWKDPIKAKVATQRGKGAIDLFFQESLQNNESIRALDLDLAMKGDLLEVFEGLSAVYDACGEDLKQWSAFILKGFYSGITLETSRHADLRIEQGAIVPIMGQIARGYAPTTIYDGACGLGTLFYYWQPERLVARDLNCSTAKMASILFEMMGINADVKQQDTLAVSEESHCADLVMMQPPFGVRIDPKQLEGLNYLFNAEESIPSSGAESLWVQKALQQADDSGRVLLHLAPGWFFRGGYDQKVRQHLFDHNLVEAIIFLPGGFLTNTAIETNLLILNKAKKSSTVKLIDTKGFGSKQRAQQVFSETEIAQVIDALFDDVEAEYVKEVTLSEIRNHQYDIHSNQYFLQDLSLEVTSIAEELVALKDAATHCQAVIAEFEALSAEFTTLSK